jgi:hypothetical protein
MSKLHSHGIKKPNDADSEALDSFTRSILYKDFEYGFTSEQQRDFERASISFADHLMRLHGLKPPDRKVWRANQYTGRGMLSILDILLETIKRGHWVLMEKIRVRKNPDRPRVGLLQDVSGSIAETGIKRGVVLLALSLLELFGRGFAKDFVISTIGNGGTREPVEYLRCQPKEAKRFLLSKNYDNIDNSNMPSFLALENNRFYEGPNTKLLFVITDGLTQISLKTRTSGWGYPWDWPAVHKDVEQTVRYIEQNIESRKNVIFFWIQVGTATDFNAFIKETGYDPNTDRSSGEYSILGKSFYKLFKSRKFFYTSIDDLMAGTSFHKLIEYLFERFQTKTKQ